MKSAFYDSCWWCWIWL